MKIVLDAMGGDHAPKATVEGAILAAEEFSIQIVLTGHRDRIDAEFAKHARIPSNISVAHAPEVVEMCDSPAVTIRKKKDSSINIGIELVKDGKADAFISAGNTGAVVCASTLILGMLEGVHRPGIGIVVPTLKGTSMLIDVGANIDPKPEHLQQYAIMADIYSKFILNKKNPTAGLLNVGQEESKGTDFIKDCRKLLGATKLNFIGNVEGRDIYNGKCDIIVCDGFVGNVVLKVSEAIADVISRLLKKELKKSPITMLGAFLSADAFKSFKREVDYTEYGGAPLFGVNGDVMICHGSSSAKAIKNAIKAAIQFSKHKLNNHIIDTIKNYK